MMTLNSMFFQTPSSIMMESITHMHDYVMMFLTTTLLMIFIKFMLMLKLKSIDMEFFENHQVETIWTIMPFLILMVIAIPSLNSLYMLDSCSFCGLDVMITGHQWYWSYNIKNMEFSEFNSYMESESSSMRLIDVDNRLVVPSNLPIRFLTTSSDVIHSWTIPSLGFKMDAIPGRINQFCVSTEKSGIYFGQCSEICGTNHSFMPIVMESVNLSSMKI